MIREEMRHKLSAILMDTCEEKPMMCNIIIGESEAMGLSSLELPVVKSMFQQPSEGIIWFNIDGCEEPIEFDDMPLEDIEDILNSIL